MIPTIPPSFIRLADGAYPIPAWHDPDPATHAEVFVEEPPEVPPGFVAELAEQPDEQNILRYTVRPLTDEEIAARNPVPESVTALQGLLALDQAGLSEAYEAWANDPARTFSERAFINKAETWRRDDATLLNAAAALGISKNQLDELFITAVTL